ncbi:MAG: glycosyltransferase [Oleispira sp.]|nr:glycosyltransferase [Oleispira sp.]
MEKVSVFIPTYNRSELLTRAVLSVLDQTYGNIEVIVVDDCSTDATKEVIAGLMLMDSRLSYYCNETNSGACVSRNLAIKHAKGRFITGLDDDDYFEINRVQEFIAAWESKDESCVGLYTDYFVINKGASTEVVNYPDRTLLGDLYVRNSVGNQIFTEVVILRMSGGFDVSLSCWQDLDAWLNLLLQNENCFLSKVKNHSYTLDKSHEHERISSGSVDKYVSSAAVLATKFDLSLSKRSRLLMQAYLYDPRSIPFATFLFSSITSLSPYVFFRSLRNYIVNKKNM